MEATVTTAHLQMGHARVIEPGDFEPLEHFYPRVLNAQVHPMVAFFMRLGPDRLIERYCHLNPRVVPWRLKELLSYQPQVLRWAGADLFHTTTAAGHRRMVVIETNSCPSGNKSMPLLAEDQEQGGYRTLMEQTFLPMLAKRGTVTGGLAVLFDKNHMEASGYASALADLAGEPVYLAPMPEDAEDPPARFSSDGVLEIRDEAGAWHTIRAAFRYVTQRPWTRLPVRSKTAILNPVLACLAGGRNKLIASKAYDLFNAELAPSGLAIRTPETIRDVRKEDAPLWVRRFGGHAVIKVPYSNAGQGVYTILSDEELHAFMNAEHHYDRFIVQSLVGNYTWSSDLVGGRFYHVGTMPNRKGEIYASDLRMMVMAGPDGFRPLAVYARRAKAPLARTVEPGMSSWDMLGTNLSEKTEGGGWAAATERLLLTDRRDFNTLGVGADDLIEAFIQTVLSTIAIDRLACNLLTQKGRLKMSLLRSLVDDAKLIAELM